MSKSLALAFLCIASTYSTAQAAPHARKPGPSTIIAQKAQRSSVDSQEIRSRLAERRALNMARLLDYANAGVFPKNTFNDGPLNVFVDTEGHICAAANLINLDGFGALVQRTAAANNYTVLAKVKKGPLMDWMLTSGFTQEEIALIQEPYMPVSGFDEPILATDVPEPVFAVAPVSVEDESARVQEVLLSVHALLSANTKKSLGIATARLQSKRKLASQFATGPRFATAD